MTLFRIADKATCITHYICAIHCNAFINDGSPDNFVCRSQEMSLAILKASMSSS